MNIEELESWIKTTKEGENWLDSQKTGLVNKNKDLIGIIKTGNAGLSELNQRIADLEKSLADKQAALKRSLILEPVKNSLEKNNVFEVLLPTLIDQLSNGMSIETNGENTLIKDADGNEVNINEIVDTWAATPAGENSIDKSRIKTEVIHTTLDVKGGTGGGVSLAGLSGRELAAMDEKSFNTAIENVMGKK